MAIAVESYDFSSNHNFVPFHLNRFRGITPVEAAADLQDEQSEAPEASVGVVQIQPGLAYDGIRLFRRHGHELTPDEDLAA